jgi:serine/threonine protein kinase
VHGDLKTLNALYVEAGSLYKWCDFGFSKKIKEVQSLTSQFASIAAETGTLFWMAPELLTAEVHIVTILMLLSLLIVLHSYR